MVIQQLRIALIKNIRIYLIESWALGMFMISASLFVIILEYPLSPIRQLIDDSLLRRFFIGLAMGLTAIILIYSRWGKQSGAHMNPAVTLSFYMLNRISWQDAFWYILFQFMGGYFGILLLKWTLFTYISSPTVNYVVTVPGQQSFFTVFSMEFLLSVIIILVVLFSSNSTKTAAFTGYFVGVLLVLFITVEAPFSGMSINPARTVASALVANEWQGWWLYFISPISGMLLAAFLFRAWFRSNNNGDCTSMSMHLSGYKYDCATYNVLGPKHLLENYNV
ncbi:MAG: aquaporin family protein [Bacteroidetes bacterium]|nr:aquaporin family protein [Bacteroidota bacterium]NCQ10965.1 aquaporin family protein [Bacteroidota bacterium]